MCNAVIIDDEQSGRQMLQALIEKYFAQQVNVVATAESVAQGAEAIRHHQPDLVFLDIEMPEASGFELFDRVKLSFEVIFVTAFSEYAIKAFKVNAIDYLLKPLDATEFRLAVNKAISRIKEKSPAPAPLVEWLKGFSKSSKIGLPLSDGSLFIDVNEIVRCESSSNYTNIYLDDGKHYLICRTLKEVEESLSGYKFLRVHRSHLINVNKVSRFSKNDGGMIILSDHSKVPINRQGREAIENLLNSF